MKDVRIDTKNERMLELLAQGATSRLIAEKMGYQDGTMRVYLHMLYRKLGVANKTEAVVWYLNRVRAKEEGDDFDRPAPRLAPEDPLGEMALEEGLHTALGVMGYFIGPYGRIWEVGIRLSGEALDEPALARRGRSRGLWRALLRGDFAYGKRLYDSEMSTALQADAPCDATLLAALLMLGGHARAGERLAGQLATKRKGAPGATPRDLALLRALREAVEGRDMSSLASLHRLATDKAAPAVSRQVAMAVLFHGYKARKDPERARQTANALWAEAEAARKHLQAMGERPLESPVVVPAPAPAKPAVREKEKAVLAR